MIPELNNVMLISGIIVIALIALMVTFAKLYTRASKEVSFVRTGAGGQKVVMNGGAFVWPVLHEIIPVNMNTLRLDVRRANEQALITRDRMRVDVQAEFYVRAQPTQEAIANAAQTLGKKTMQPDSLKELVEGKFVDALRSVAAEMGMEELHEQRTNFVQKVQQAVTEDLLKNGLELESVSLTGLDQTSKEHFNPDNAFDAEGLTKLTEAIEARRKKRNDIEQETQVLIERKNLEAAQQKLEIAREQEYAQLAQEREVEVRRASQQAEIARERAEQRQDAEKANIEAQKNIDQSQIDSQREVENRRIEMEQALRERDVTRERAIETAEVEKARAIRLAEQDREIAIAEKSKAQSLAQKEADEALALATRAAEQVTTAREIEIADRKKQIELVEASKEAEREKIELTIAAIAEKEAAEDRADSIRTLAQAEADKVRIAAEADSESEKVRAEGLAEKYRVEAEGKRAINEASNTLSVDQIAMQIKMAIVQALPDIIRESVKPMQQIEGIRIVHVDGLSGGNSVAPEGVSVGPANLADQVVNSALRYRAQAPLVESILNEVGLSGASLDNLTRSVRESGNGNLATAQPAKDADKS